MGFVDSHAHEEPSPRSAAVLDAQRLRRDGCERLGMLLAPSAERHVGARRIEGRDELRSRPDGLKLTGHGPNRRVSGGG